MHEQSDNQLSSSIRPWLFDDYPVLRGRLPWIHLVDAPTPVYPLPGISRIFNREIWIKREDLSSSLYGGNKPRKLEFILAEALLQKKTDLFTGGGLGTNHGLATAIFGKHLGLNVRLSLFAQPVTNAVREQVCRLENCRANLTGHPSLMRFALNFYIRERFRQKGAYVIPPGGSSPLGVLGYVDAGLEIGRQVRSGLMPTPSRIFVAAGTCGTLAGLLVGLKLTGIDSRLVGVQVTPSLAATPRKTLRLARAVIKLMNRHGAKLPKITLRTSDFDFVTGQLGSGYGRSTPAGNDGVKLMAEHEGIRLDPVYTGKTFAGLRHYVQHNNDTHPLLFVQTYYSIKDPIPDLETSLARLPSSVRDLL